MKKKIAIITNIPSPYRVDFFYYLQTHYEKFDIWVMYTSINEDNRSWQIEEEKLKNSIFVKSKVIKKQNKLDVKYIHIPWNIGSQLSKMKPDIVVAMEYNPAALCAMFWCKIHKRKLVHWTDGTLHSEQDIGKLQVYARKIMIKYADSYIASSTRAKEKLEAYGALTEKIFISLLTVDLEKYRMNGSRRKENQILYVGSISFRKGLDLLFPALTKLKHMYEMVIVGEGAEQEKLELLARKLGIGDQIKFVGFKEKEELRNYYAESSIFVLPTRQDCFALVLLEALCAGLPVVTSKYADGAYDLVEDGVNGYIADPYHAEEFAEKIDNAFEHQEQLSVNCQAGLDKFRFENVAIHFMKAAVYAENT